ncbi:hypothetical protein [Streptomyces puniciscabiei]|uniref:hypothetical protein n=1 Tax=Streptomyces puniciscabiei TaxID=164348 RepID=UPI00331A4018
MLLRVGAPGSDYAGCVVGGFVCGADFGAGSRTSRCPFFHGPCGTHAQSHDADAEEHAAARIWIRGTGERSGETVRTPVLMYHAAAGHAATATAV